MDKDNPKYFFMFWLYYISAATFGTSLYRLQMPVIVIVIGVVVSAIPHFAMMIGYLDTLDDNLVPKIFWGWGIAMSLFSAMALL